MLSLPNTASDWTVEISIENSSTPLRLSIKNELVIGRPSPDQAVFTGLDLTPFGAVDLGVSRQHAVIRWDGSHLAVVDLHSDNGTVLNGLRLQPDIPYRINDGDLLFVGHLKMKLHVNTYIGQTSVKARRVAFDTLNIPAKGKGQRILIVEDDIYITKLYQRVFEEAGFVTQISRDVVSAIRVLNQYTPSLIILDIRLPSVHGLELCRYVRRDTECPTIPIIVASALGDDETIQQAMTAGVDVYLNKPLHLKEMVRIGMALINKHEAENPMLHTKKLEGTASLDFIAAAPRKDTIIIFVEGQREPVGTVVEREIAMGRGMAGSQARTYLDLSNYGAFDKGVSRMHARIKRTGAGFQIEDLGSANGTFVNGHSLAPLESSALKNGDEVRLGDLRMHIYLLADTDTMGNGGSPSTSAAES